MGDLPAPNWSNGFLDEFKKYRGYDPRPYLPALAGRVVGSAEVTGRFLYDYRNTIGDCVADHYFGRLGQLAAAKGLIQQSEAGGPVPGTLPAMDCLKNLGRCDIPMGEFWQDGSWVEANQNKNGKQTASAAHLYGKRIAAAEAFTSFVHWVDSPATLKPTADRAFCEGLNHFFIFSSATHSGDGFPGTEFYAGTHFNRKITWWNQAVASPITLPVAAICSSRGGSSPTCCSTTAMVVPTTCRRSTSIRRWDRAMITMFAIPRCC